MRGLPGLHLTTELTRKSKYRRTKVMPAYRIDMRDHYWEEGDTKAMHILDTTGIVECSLRVYNEIVALLKELIPRRVVRVLTRCVYCPSRSRPRSAKTLSKTLMDTEYRTEPSTISSHPSKRQRLDNNYTAEISPTKDNLPAPPPFTTDSLAGSAPMSTSAGASVPSNTTAGASSTTNGSTPHTTTPPAPQMLQIKRLTPNARLPTRGSALAAGYDIYASEEAVIPAHGRGLVATGIAMAVPVGTYGRVAPRSGLAVKHGISTGAGVIDADYRGEVKVVLFNHSDAPFSVAVGDRVAQLVLEVIVNPEVCDVEAAGVELGETVRGAGGFGSTGGFGATNGGPLKTVGVTGQVHDMLGASRGADVVGGHLVGGQI
ncbi:hypothetical protein MRB53_036882 [Persea americana]|nr:hypothetical protein MRB53_036882 [Persea americana]